MICYFLAQQSAKRVFYTSRALEEYYNNVFFLIHNKGLLGHKKHVKKINLQFVEVNIICDHLELTTFL